VGSEMCIRDRLNTLISLVQMHIKVFHDLHFLFFKTLTSWKLVLHLVYLHHLQILISFQVKNFSLGVDLLNLIYDQSSQCVHEISPM